MSVPNCSCVVGLAFVLVARQMARRAPLLPIDLLRIPLFALSVATSVCAFVAQSMALVSLPFLFEDTLGFDAVETGLLMTPWPLTVAVIAPISGRLADRYPVGILSGCGLAVMALGLVSLGLLPAHPAPIDIVWRMTICGLGFGFFNTPNNRAIITSAPPVAHRRRQRHAGDRAPARPDHGRGAGGAGVRRVPGERHHRQHDVRRGGVGRRGGGQLLAPAGRWVAARAGVRGCGGNQDQAHPHGDAPWQGETGKHSLGGQPPSSKWSTALMTASSFCMRLPTLPLNREVRTTPIACVARNQVWPSISKHGFSSGLSLSSAAFGNSGTTARVSRL